MDERFHDIDARPPPSVCVKIVERLGMETMLR
jgi:hypothetical protein